MRIAFFSDNFYPELSGISDSLISLAKALAKKGHEINFYVPKYSKNDYKIIGLNNAEELDLGNNIKITRFFSLPFPGGSGTKQARLVFPTLWRYLKVKKFKPDIIHTNLFFGVGLEALIASKFLKVPLVGTNHTAVTEFVRYSPIKTEGFKRLSLRYVIWYYNHCRFVSMPGKSLLLEMENGGLKPEHRVISNPLDLEIFQPGLETEKAKLKNNFKLTSPTLVYAGRLAPEKNIDVLIRALPQIKKKFSQVCLALAGHGADAENLKNLARSLGVESAVKFLGTIDKNSLAKLYQASEIFVIASTSETQGLTILQAMACGIPTLGADSRGVADTIREKEFLFKPNDYSGLAKKAIQLLEKKELRQRSIQNGARYVKNFSGEAIAKEWERVYTKFSFKN